MESGFLHYSSSHISPNYQSTPLNKEGYEKDMPKFSGTNYQPVSLKFSSSKNTTHSTGEKQPSSYSWQPTSSIHLMGSQANGSYRKSSPGSSKLNDVDSNTIARQRHELQLMITELKDRDRELNELVSSHHQQLVTWEVDRQRLVTVEKHMTKFKVELKKRSAHCKLLKERLKLYEDDVHTKNKALESTQTQLQQVSKQATEYGTQVHELKAKNGTLKRSVEELSKTLANIQAKDQQVSTILRLKDKDISDANTRIEELTQKLKKSNKHLLQYKQRDDDCKEEADKLIVENTSLKQELGELKETVANQNNSNGESLEEATLMKQEILVLQKELLLTGEREKRKDSLLELSRSKQERTEMELKHTRKLYETLQKEYMQMKEQFYKQDDEMSVMTFSDIDSNDPMRISSVLEKMNVLEQSASSSIGKCEEQGEKDKRLQNSVSDIRSSSSSMCKKQLVNNSFESADVGSMTAAELKDSDPSYLLASEDDRLVQDESSSPTSRLHKLLTESRQMVKNLENSPVFSSLETTPERTEHVEKGVENELDSPPITMNFNDGDDDDDGGDEEDGEDEDDEYL